MSDAARCSHGFNLPAMQCHNCHVERREQELAALNDSLAREGRLGNEIDALRSVLREARAHVHTLDAAWIGPWCERVAVAIGETKP